MKRKFTLIGVALAGLFGLVQSASAASELTTGSSYYIQNAESGLFLCGANYWGTQASVSVQGEMFQLDKAEDGTYTITDLSLSCANKTLGYNLYTDTNTGENGNAWTIAPVEGEDGVFTIYGKGKANNTDDSFEGYLAQSTTAGVHIGYTLGSVTTIDNTAKWYILTKEEAIAKLNAATKAAPIDASFLIGDANFGRNHSNTAWSVTASNKNLAGGANENMCAESWQSAFDINQTLSDLPNGVYELTAQAALTDYAGLWDGANYAVVYANNASASFNSMEGNDRSSNMSTLSAAFTAGSYGVGPIKATVTDGTLKIGVKGTRTDTWCIWDNFQIKYYGVDLTALKENLASLITTAQAISGKMKKTVADDLAAAITAAQNCEETQAAIEAATTALTNATTAANTSISEYTAIAALNEKAAALDEKGVAAYAETLEAYNNETTTLAEAQAAYETAVKAQGVGAELVSIAPTTWVGQTGSLAAGSWANATSFSFAERYAGAAIAAGENVLTQTITGLQNGTYDVTLNLAGSYTSGRGFECSTGDNLSVGFANDSTANLPIVERTTLAADGATSMTLAATVTDGTLTYGIKNIADAGNWYAANVSSIIFKEAAKVVSAPVAWDWTPMATPEDTIQTLDVTDYGTVTFSTVVGTKTDVLSTDNFVKFSGASVNLTITLPEGKTFNAGDTLTITTKGGKSGKIGWLLIDGTSLKTTSIPDKNTNVDASSATYTDKIVLPSDWIATNSIKVRAATASETDENNATGGGSFYVGNIKYNSYVEGEGTATGISEVATVVKATPAKFIKNGKLVIVKNGKQYNAAGALLK